MSVDNKGYYLNKNEREELYLEAEYLYNNGGVQEAIVMYLKCLQHLNAATSFNSLPKCLRSLSNHFFEEKDYTKAVHFLQAERLYYETALLDTSAFMKKVYDAKAKSKLAFSQCLFSNQEEDSSKSLSNKVVEFECMKQYFQDNNYMDESQKDFLKDTLPCEDNIPAENVSKEMKNNNEEFVQDIDNSNIELGESDNPVPTSGDELCYKNSVSITKVCRFPSKLSFIRLNNQTILNYLDGLKLPYLLCALVILMFGSVLWLNIYQVSTVKPPDIIQTAETVDDAPINTQKLKSEFKQEDIKLNNEIRKNDIKPESFVDKINSYEEESINQVDLVTNLDKITENKPLETQENLSNENVQPLDAILNPIIDMYKKFKDFYCSIIVKKDIPEKNGKNCQ